MANDNDNSDNGAPGGQDGAEMLDADKLGGDGVGAARRVEEDYPPERPLGVEDPAVLQGGSETPDDLTTREWRTRDESGIDR